MAIVMASGGTTPGPVSVTLTFGRSTTPTTSPTPTTTPPTTTPGATTHPGHDGTPKNLPFTGMPAVAELDVALVLAVLGATLVTVVNRLTQRA